VAPLSLTGRILQFIVWFCCVRPKVTVVVALATAALGTGYSAHYLTFETSKFHLLPLGQRYATLYKDYAEDFGQLEDIVVVVESPAVETSTAYAVRLASALRDKIPEPRASAIGSTPAVSKPTRCCTCRTTRWNAPS
jgi:predicted RND superfamily exporter protein